MDGNSSTSIVDGVAVPSCEILAQRIWVACARAFLDQGMREETHQFIGAS